MKRCIEKLQIFATPRPSTPAIRSDRAFTLVELLVVVSIIALLVAMLLPALNEARNLAKITVCASNQRQIGIAWNVYLASNDFTFPRLRLNIHWFYGGKDPVIFSWPNPVLGFRPLNPYISLREQDERWAQIFQCPGDRPIKDIYGQLGVTHGNTTFEYFGNSYPMNYHLLIPWDRESKKYLRSTDSNARLDDVEFSHSRVVLLGDCQWYYTTFSAPWDAQFHSPPDHMNLAFLDGHVAFTRVFRLEEMASGEIPDYIISPHRGDTD